MLTLEEFVTRYSAGEFPSLAAITLHPRDVDRFATIIPKGEPPAPNILGWIATPTGLRIYSSWQVREGCVGLECAQPMTRIALTLDAL